MIDSKALPREEFTACLGIESWGKCRYDPHAPGVYFSLGDIAAVLALLIAFAQFASPQHKFRWRLSPGLRQAAIGLFSLSVLCVLTAAVLPSLLGTVVPVVGFPIFWETLGTLLLIACILCSFRLLFKSPVFGARNASRYFQEARTLLRRGDTQSLVALAEEITVSIPPLSALASTGAKKSERKDLVSQPELFAIRTIDLFADKDIARLLVDTYPDQTLALLTAIFSDDSGKWGRSVSEELIHQAFVSQQSLLNREGGYAGLGRQKAFEQLVFGEYRVVQSWLRPLQAPQFWQLESMSPAIAQRYGQCLITAFQGYFDSGLFYAPPHSLVVGIENLAGLAGNDLRVTAKSFTEAEFWRSSAYRATSEVASALCSILKVAKRNDDKLPVFEMPPDVRKLTFDDISPYGALAMGIFKFLEELSWIEGHDDAVRTLAIELWLEVEEFASTQELPRCLLEVQKRLRRLLLERIDFNLNEQAYPGMVRVLIGLIGLNDSAEVISERFFADEFHNRLREAFAGCHAMDANYAELLLPKRVKFVADSPHFEISPNYRKGKVSKFILQCAVDTESNGPPTSPSPMR